MTERTKPTARRLFRRFRAQFKKDLGIKTPRGAERILIDQAALLSLRARQMRDDILEGEKVISDEDLVRTTNACIRAMGMLQEVTTTKRRGKPPGADLADHLAKIKAKAKP
jgi:hypothetical protein